jgi:hypothetical protein
MYPIPEIRPSTKGFGEYPAQRIAVLGGTGGIDLLWKLKHYIRRLGE